MGDRLRKARRSADISAEDMAALLFRHPNTVGNWESDTTKPKPRVLAKWAEVTQVPLVWLQDGDVGDSEPGSVDRRAPRSVTAGKRARQDAARVLHLVKAA